MRVWFCCTIFVYIIRTCLKAYIAYFVEGYEGPPGKRQSYLKSQFPPEMALLKSQQRKISVAPKITPISNIYFKRFLR